MSESSVGPGANPSHQPRGNRIGASLRPPILGPCPSVLSGVEVIQTLDPPQVRSLVYAGSS